MASKAAAPPTSKGKKATVPGQVTVLCHADSREYLLDPNKSLLQHVAELCQLFAVTGQRDKYVLMLDHSNHYVTETDLTTGTIPVNASLRLKLRPEEEAALVLPLLRDPQQQKKALFDLKAQLKDPTFLREFYIRKGVTLLVELISNVDAPLVGNTLAYALAALAACAALGLGLNEIQQPVALRLLAQLSAPTAQHSRPALSILESCASSAAVGGVTVTRWFSAYGLETARPPYAELVGCLRNPDLSVIAGALGCINALVGGCSKDAAVRESLMAEFTSLDLIPMLKSQRIENNEMWRTQMFHFQQLMLDDVRKAKTPYDKNNELHEATLLSLWSLVFPDTPLQSRVGEQWKLLGFQGKDPATDFRGAGLLGLKNMIYFGEHHGDKLRKLVASMRERGSREYPLATACINVTQMLYELLRVDDTTNTGPVYLMLLDHSHPFEEIYVAAVMLMDTTWDAMEASYMMFPQVIAAVRKTLTSALDSPASQSLNLFTQALGKLGGQRTEEQSPGLVSLKSKVRQDALALVRSTLATQMMEGTVFRDPRVLMSKQRPAQPMIGVRLNRAMTELQWGQLADNTPLPALLPNIVPLTTVAGVVTGLNTPISAQLKAKKIDDSTIAEVLSFLLKNGQNLDLQASNRSDFVMWSDGVRLLTGGRAETSEVLDDVRFIAEAEFECRLLDLPISAVPLDAPTVPPPPTNFFFVNPDEETAALNQQKESRLAGHTLTHSQSAGLLRTEGVEGARAGPLLAGRTGTPQRPDPARTLSPSGRSAAAVAGETLGPAPTPPPSALMSAIKAGGVSLRNSGQLGNSAPSSMEHSSSPRGPAATRSEGAPERPSPGRVLSPPRAVRPATAAADGSHAGANGPSALSPRSQQARTPTPLPGHGESHSAPLPDTPAPKPAPKQFTPTGGAGSAAADPSSPPARFMAAKPAGVKSGSTRPASQFVRAQPSPARQPSIDDR